MLSFIGSLAQSAAAQAAYAISYTQLFSLISWTSVGLMGATAAVAGQNLGAKQPERARRSSAYGGSFRTHRSLSHRFLFLLFPGPAIRPLWDERTRGR